MHQDDWLAIIYIKLFDTPKEWKECRENIMFSKTLNNDVMITKGDFIFHFLDFTGYAALSKLSSIAPCMKTKSTMF